MRMYQPFNQEGLDDINTSDEEEDSLEEPHLLHTGAHLFYNTCDVHLQQQPNGSENKLVLDREYFSY